jgi:hypothetical protein
VLRTFIPSPDEQIREAIDALRSLDLANATVDEVKEHVQVLVTGHSICAPIFDPPIKLYRARKVELLPTFLREIGAPPPEKVVLDQRCNRAGQSLFYCSTARNAPFFEVHAQVGDGLVLSEWRTLTKMTVNHVGYTQSNFTQLQSGRECPDWSKASFQPTDKMRMVDEFFSSFFSVDVPKGQEPLYKATIAITEQLIPIPTEPGPVRFDGLMYPTIPMKGNCENFALRKEFVEHGVAFVKADYIKIRAIEGTQITFDKLDFANSVRADGALEWKGRLGQWTIRQHGGTLQFSVNEQGEWIARDMNGEVVPME